MFSLSDKESILCSLDRAGALRFRFRPWVNAHTSAGWFFGVSEEESVLKSLLCASIFLLLLFFTGSLRASTIGLTAAAGYLNSNCGGQEDIAGSTPVSSSTLKSSAQLPCDFSFYSSSGGTVLSYQIVGLTQENMNNAPCTALPCETPAVSVQGEVEFSGPPGTDAIFTGVAALEYSVAIDQTSSPPVPVSTVPVAVYFQTEIQGNNSYAYGWVVGPSGKQDLPQNKSLSAQVPVGIAYFAHEEVGCSAGGGDAGFTSSCLAVADPAFEFDQAAFDAEMQAEGLASFSLSDYFTFEYSPNLTAPTPEPSSLSLLWVGLLLSTKIWAARSRQHRG